MPPVAACGSRLPRRPTPSACAAGTAARTSAAMRATRYCARAASVTSKAPASKGNTYDQSELERLALAAAVGGSDRRRPAGQGMDRAPFLAVRAGARAAGAGCHPHLQHRCGVQFSVTGFRVAALGVRVARPRCEHRADRLDAALERAHARAA